MTLTASTPTPGAICTCATGATNRVMVFSPQGKLLGQWPVLRKFSALGAGAPKELASLQGDIALMALAPHASPARLWVATGRAAKGGLRPVTDEGDTLKMGNRVDNANGVCFPAFVTGDPDRIA